MSEINIGFKDLYVTPEEFMDLVLRVYEKQDSFGKINEKGHPEDIFYGMDLIFRSVGYAISEYTTDIVQDALRKSRS